VTPLDIVEDRLRSRGLRVSRRDDSITAQCPAHEDKSPSLSVGVGTKGRDVVITCHAGCDSEAVMAALDLKWTDFGEAEQRPVVKRLAATYPYCDANGTMLYRVHRMDPKSFWQQRVDANGQWVTGLGDVERVLYHLPDIIAAVAAGRTIWLAEGEKDVDNLRAHGLDATCNSGGAGKFLPQHADVLRGATVTIVVDRDATGWKHAREVTALLKQHDCIVTTVAAAIGKDASDHLGAGLTVDQFERVDLSTDSWGDTPEPWPEPIPLGEADDRPAFPLEVLPPEIIEHARNAANDLQVAVDLPAMLALGALSTVLSGHYVVDVNGSGWEETLNLYLVVAMAPGAGKSPVQKAMVGPINEHEIGLRLDAEGRAEHVEQKRRIIEKQMKKAEERGDLNEAAAFAQDLIKTPKVVIPRLIADDATPEALTDLLSKQGGRMAIISTEGGPFDIMAGRYSEAANLDVYLKAWSGDSIRVDRVGRGSVTIERPLLTFVLTVQPSVIEGLGDKPEFRGRGLTTRFMYAVPEDYVGYRDMGASSRSDRAVRLRYEAYLNALIARHAEVPARPAVIVIDDDAWSEFVGFRQGLEDRRKPTGELRALAEWTTKLESSVARLAGIFAVVDGATAIDVPTMRRAIAVGHYWLSHAKLVHDMWGTDDRVTAARAVLDWARERRLDEFTVRDLQMGLRRVFPTAQDTVPALDLLTERGWLRPMFDGSLVVGRRGKPSPGFRVHPNLWISTAHVSHVSHVLRAISKPLSICLSTDSKTRSPTHETHETHERESGAVAVMTTESDETAPDAYIDDFDF
jgi:hypothetical protein